MGETEKNLQAALAKLSSLSKKGLGIARDSIVQSSHVVKSKIDITSLQRGKKKFTAELGEAVYSAIKEGKLRSKLFDGVVSNIDEVVNHIDEIETEMKTSKKETVSGEEATSEKDSTDKLK